MLYRSSAKQSKTLLELKRSKRENNRDIKVENEISSVFYSLLSYHREETLTEDCNLAFGLKKKLFFSL